MGGRTGAKEEDPSAWKGPSTCYFIVAGAGGAPEGARGLQLATLTALAGGYVLANVLGITLTENGVWRAMYFAGLVVGAALFVSAARALLEDQRSTQSEQDRLRGS